MKAKASLLAVALVLVSIPWIPQAGATHYCPSDTSVDSRARLTSSERDTVRDTSVTITNPGDSNITFEGASGSGTSWIDVSTDSERSQGETLTPNESVTVTATASIDPDISEGSHTVSFDVKFDEGDCSFSWDLFVIKEPIVRIDLGEDDDLGEVFKGDTPNEGRTISDLNGNVTETTGFDGANIQPPAIDCGDLSDWISLDVTGWPRSVNASGEEPFSATLHIDAETPYEEAHGERFGCSVESSYTSSDGDGSGTATGSIDGELVWPATLGPLEIEPATANFTERRGSEPRWVPFDITGTIQNIGDEKMTLPPDTYQLTPNARLQVKESIELPPIDDFGGPEPKPLPAELELKDTVSHEKKAINGTLRTEQFGDAGAAFPITINQPHGIRMEPTQVNRTASRSLEIGNRTQLPFELFETHGYRSVHGLEIEPVQLDSDSLPSRAKEPGEPEWVRIGFQRESIPPDSDPTDEEGGWSLKAQLAFLPGAKPNCPYGFKYRVSGDGVDSTSFTIVAEPTQPDRERILSDLETTLAGRGDTPESILELFRSALSQVKVAPEEACNAEATVVADNQRLLTVAGGVTTYFQDGLWPAMDAPDNGSVADLGDRLATAASALQVIRNQEAAMSGSNPQADQAVQDIAEVLQERLRDELNRAAGVTFCEPGRTESNSRCTGRMAPRLSSGRMLSEAARIAGLNQLETNFTQKTQQLEESHRSLVQEAFDRFRNGDTLASDARRDHLMRIGGSYWLINPFRYGFYMGAVDEAKKDLRTAKGQFRMLGDGSMEAASQERLSQIRSQQNTAQNTFFLASFVYLGLFGLFVVHLARSSLRYRREIEEAEMGGFLRVTEAPPVSTSSGGGGPGELPPIAGGDPRQGSEREAFPEGATGGSGQGEHSGPETTELSSTLGGRAGDEPITDGKPEVIRLDEDDD